MAALPGSGQRGLQNYFVKRSAPHLFTDTHFKFGFMDELSRVGYEFDGIKKKPLAHLCEEET